MLQLGPIEKLGTVWWFEFFDLDNKGTEHIQQPLELVIDQFEKNYSRFLGASLTSQLNNNGVLVNPSAEFIELLEIAHVAYKETNSVFNIAVGDYLEKSGYDKNYSFLADDDLPEILDLNQVLTVSTEKITLSDRARIDLGGFGKGFLIDKLAQYFLGKSISRHFLINGGGDIYVTTDGGESVPINLQDSQSGQVIGSIQLQNKALAVSSPTHRSWRDANGNTHSHLIQSGTAGAHMNSAKSVEHQSTMYVTAPSCVQADIWATSLAISPDLVIPKHIQVLTHPQGVV